MPLWIAIMIAGVAGCGFLFLKAREIERAAPYKKVKQGNMTVKKAAQKVAARPSTLIVNSPDFKHGAVSVSADMPSRVAKEIEEIQRDKEG